MRTREFLRTHLAMWQQVEEVVDVVPAIDHRFCGEYLIGTALIQSLRAVVREYTQSERIGDESMREFCARWADKYLTIAFYDWQASQSSFVLRHHAAEMLKAALKHTTDIQQLVLLGAGLIVGLESDHADMSDLFSYMESVYEFIEVGVRLDLSALGLRDI
ncbi:MAG: hypothetical protein QXI61_05750 [Nitrososphaerota archaeon]